MDFGLGLVLSFTDNATAGINNAVNSLNQLTSTAENASKSLDQMASLSALSVVSNNIGNGFLSAGHTILSTLSQVISKVNATGQTLMYAESQLGKLYENSGKTGKDVLDDITQYAKTSIFEFEDLIPVVTMLKANGIEAFDMIASSTGNANQTLMDYAADLAAFNPQMKNAYGTGIKAAMGALNEYIAEGNAMSLKRGASLDITGLLGEEKGATIEERSRQVADLLEKLNMVGMTAQLANSPMTKLSNMSDTLFQFIGMISQSGVYDKFSELISKVSDYIMAIPDEELQSIAQLIGESLTSIMKPLEWVIDKILSLVDCIRELMSNNPQLAKFVTIGVSIVGVLLVLSGVAFKAISSLSSLSIVVLTFGKSFGIISNSLKAGSLKILSTLIPLTATIGLLALAWKSDFAGIRTNVTYFVNSLVTSFKTAYSAVNGSVSDLISTLSELRNKGDFFSNLTIGLMKVMMLFKSLSDGWNDYTLSEDNFLKAKELGILPLIEAILDFKYRFDNFKQGFIDGWQKISDKVKEVVSGFLDSLDGTIFDSLIEGVTSFFEKLSSGDAQSWYDFGESFANITAGVLAFVIAFKTVKSVIGIITKVITAVKGVWSVIKGIATIVKNVFSVVSKVISKIIPIISKIGSFLTTTLGGITLIITGVITAVSSFFSMLSNGFSWVKEILMIVGIALTAIGAIILGAPALIAGVIAGIVALIATLIVVIKDNWEKIKEFFANIGEWCINTFKNAVQAVKDFFSPLGDFFKTVWDNIVSTFTDIGTKISDAISGAVKGAINTVLSGAVGIINGFIKAINVAIGVINAIPGVEINKLTELSVPALAQGGIVNKPTTALIGEAGKEAIVPLENNLGWITQLAGILVSQLDSIRPTNTSQINTTNNGGSEENYLTKTTNNNQTIQGDTDNSIVFNEGAIQVTVQNASEEEAIRFAKKVLEYIKRQRQLDQMMSYA